MATPSSSPQGSHSASAAARKRRPQIIGAVAGAVIGGVLGVLAAKKVRDGSAKRLMPAKVPALAKQATGAAKNFAHDAKRVAKATAVIAADAALVQIKKAAEQFAVEVVSGQPPTLPKPPAPSPEAADTPAATSAKPATAGEQTAKKGAAATTGAKPKAATAKKPRAPKPPAKSAQRTATVKPR